jgi:thioesterase domain-containing protein
MIPVDYVFLDALPLSRNGKLDRAALPAPARSATETAPRAPRTPRERLLCDLFAEVLDLEHVGIDDNFFELGGHSLLAARVIGAARSTLGAGLSVADVFRAPTVAELARCGDPEDGDLVDVVLPIRPAGDQRPLFLVHPAIGLSWCYVGLARFLPDVPLFALQARAISSPELAPATLAEMAADYVAQVRRIQPHGPYRLAGWSFGGNVAHAMAALLQECGEGVELLALMDSYPYAGAAGPITAEAPVGADPSAIALQLGQYVKDESYPGRMAVIAEVLSRDIWLAERHTPSVFQGDVVFIRANRHPDGPSVDGWREFVSGQIHVHPVDASHFEMLRPKPLASVAAVLRRSLARESP